LKNIHCNKYKTVLCSDRERPLTSAGIVSKKALSNDYSIYHNNRYTDSLSSLNDSTKDSLPSIKYKIPKQTNFSWLNKNKIIINQ